MRSRKAAAMLHGFRTLAVLGLLMCLAALNAGLASAATESGRAVSDQADTVVQSGMSATLPGEVGMVAILAGGIGLVLGLLRRHRRSVARRAAERAASALAPPAAARSSA